MQPFLVCFKDNEEQEGIAISENLTWVPQTDGQVKPLVLIGVLWNETRTPSPSYHQPEELIWNDMPGMTDDDEEDPENMSEEDINDAIEKHLNKVEELNGYLSEPAQPNETVTPEVIAPESEAV